jgi:hypothetical protein
MVKDQAFAVSNGAEDHEDKDSEKRKPQDIGQRKGKLLFSQKVDFAAQRNLIKQLLDGSERTSPPADDLVAHNSQEAVEQKAKTLGFNIRSVFT